MRQIKFRGKKLNRNEWLHGYFYKQNNELSIIRDDSRRQEFPVDENTVGQFTGLKDCKDVDIYEGDIVSFYDEVEDDILSGTVVYDTDDCSFCIKRNGYENASLVRYWQYEVIGNIYDKKLLEEEK